MYIVISSLVIFPCILTLSFSKHVRWLHRNFVAFHSIPFRSIPFHSVTFRSIPFHSVTFRYIPLHSVTFRSIPFHSIPFRSYIVICMSYDFYIALSLLHFLVISIHCLVIIILSLQFHFNFICGFLYSIFFYLKVKDPDPHRNYPDPQDCSWGSCFSLLIRIQSVCLTLIDWSFSYININ